MIFVFICFSVDAKTAQTNGKYFDNNWLINFCSSKVKIISIRRQIINWARRQTAEYAKVRNCSIKIRSKCALSSKSILSKLRIFNDNNNWLRLQR